LDSMSRSPLFDRFTASLRGSSCIRAFQREEVMQQHMVALLDSNARAWFWWLITNRFIGFRLDMQCVVIMAFAAVGGAALRDLVGPELIGLAIVQSISLSGLFQYMVRMSAMVESYMTSFERLRAYAILPRETDDGDKVPQAPFPPKGAITFTGLHMRYREDLPLVLKGVDLQCPAGAKIGICGRTGCGKSSLFVALSRLAQITDGFVTIDGVDTASLPLQTLRSCISWVPQEPSFFSGSIRLNLDPLGQYPETELWAALKAVQMVEILGADGLDLTVAEQGSNFSAGEQQLLSLARALLQRRQILCMDEAFANVDLVTDGKVQTAIKVATKHTGTTVLVIAHRIKSLADSDYIVVMDGGVVQEQGSPQELLERRGVYARMALESTLDTSNNSCDQDDAILTEKDLKPVLGPLFAKQDGLSQQSEPILAHKRVRL